MTAAASSLDPSNNPALAPHLLEARRLARAGLPVLCLGLVPALAWLALAPLASAVVAHAHVKVDLDRRPVQHPEGGIVREVKVRDQRVAQGEALLVLGDVSVDAALNRLGYRLPTERAGVARLEAEQVGQGALAFAPDLLEAAKAEPRLAEQLAEERDLFGARRESLHGQTAGKQGHLSVKPKRSRPEPPCAATTDSAHAFREENEHCARRWRT